MPSVYLADVTALDENAQVRDIPQSQGRYLPVFASEVYDQNAKLAQAGLTPINLKSIMIGNGLTDNFRMIPSYYDIQCTGASVAPFQDIRSLCLFIFLDCN